MNAPESATPERRCYRQAREVEKARGRKYFRSYGPLLAPLLDRCEGGELVARRVSLNVRRAV